MEDQGAGFDMRRVKYDALGADSRESLCVHHFKSHPFQNTLSLHVDGFGGRTFDVVHVHCEGCLADVDKDRFRTPTQRNGDQGPLLCSGGEEVAM